MDGEALDLRAPNVIGPARPPNHDVIAAGPDGFALLTTPEPLPRVRFYPPPTGWLQTRPRKKTAAARSYQGRCLARRSLHSGKPRTHVSLRPDSLVIRTNGKALGLLRPRRDSTKPYPPPGDSPPRSDTNEVNRCENRP